MGAPLGSYAFLPWLRRGMATEIARVDGTGPDAPRASVPVELDFNNGDLSASASLDLLGPGEVTGIDPRAVIRTWPASGASEAESNGFPLVEFDQSDLPWRYTPAKATATDRLRPWICLIVLAPEDIASYTPAGPKQRLPVVRVSSAQALPNLAQSWAWAHTQAAGVKSVSAQDAAAILAANPHTMLSRLLSPRRLDPQIPYRAFVVPAFERGRLAGLGQPVPDTLDGTAPAWAANAGNIDLPCYYEWQFHTGPAGDFESLVRRLRARTIPATVGSVPLDVSAPGQGLPPAASMPLGLESALRSTQSTSTPWDPAEQAAFIAKLRALLNLPADLLSAPAPIRVVAPPLYGQWHAAQSRLTPGAPPPWFQSLNSDPRLRTAGGLGTAVVQDQQQALMASAWQQVDRIAAINEKLRWAQLAREAAAQVYSRHIAQGDAGSVLLLTARVHSRIAAAASPTARKLLDASPVSSGALQGQFRRISRPLGPIGRRQGRNLLPAAAPFLNRMNTGALSPAPPPPKPAQMATQAAAGKVLVPDKAPPIGTPAFDDYLRRTALRDGRLTTDLIGKIPALSTFTLTELLPGTHPWQVVIKAGLGTLGETVSPQIKVEPPPGGVAPTPPIDVAPPVPADNTQARLLRASLTSVFTRFNSPIATGPQLRSVDITTLSNQVVAALDPKVTIPQSLRARMVFAPGIVWNPRDPLEQVMAYPEFPQPMYEPLRDLSQDWLLAGLDQVPADTVSLLLTNQRFVEAYMVGLNHEMARELLWNEYPTDQRGSYFRQFWDVRGLPATALDDDLHDIELITDWPSTSALGANSARKPPPGGDYLVLLVRGEVLRRYPNTIVYAARAQFDSLGGRHLTGQESHPLFKGTLNPDVSFFGFELTAKEVVGGTSPSISAGWFFVLQEQPSECRFGLNVPSFPPDPLTAWSSLSWAHLAPDRDGLNAIVNIDLDAALPDTSQVTAASGDPVVVWHANSGTGPAGSRASDLAFITLQKPVRIAVHGSQMLPKGT
jgi:hypothetical protein